MMHGLLLHLATEIGKLAGGGGGADVNRKQLIQQDFPF